MTVKELVELTGKGEKTIRRDVAFLESTSFPVRYHRGVAFLEEEGAAQSYSGGMAALVSALAASIGRRFSSWTDRMLPSPSKGLMQSLLLRLNLEEIGERFDTLLEIERAISQNRCVSFRYEKQGKKGDVIEAAPVKIMVSEGRWYLAAWRPEKIQTYKITCISDLRLTAAPIVVPPEARRTIEEAANVWFETSCEPFTARLYVAPKAASYVLERPLAPTQEVAEYHHDGGLEITMRLTAEMEIIPAIQYWIPYIYPIAPERLRKKFEKNLRESAEFLHQMGETDR